MSVSVVMTCHNEEAFIEEAIRSVAAQTAYDEVDEIIVVNDGSSDGSQALLERLAREIGKIRITPDCAVLISGGRLVQINRIKKFSQLLGRFFGRIRFQRGTQLNLTDSDFVFLQSLQVADRVFELNRRVAERVNVPLIASGGAGKMEHFAQVLTAGKADAALAASLFHDGVLKIQDLKTYLAGQGVNIRASVPQ